MLSSNYKTMLDQILARQKALAHEPAQQPAMPRPMPAIDRIVASGTLRLSDGRVATLRLNAADLNRMQMMGLLTR